MITDWTSTPCTLSSNHTVLWSQAKRTKVFSVDTFMCVTVIFIASSACNMQHRCSAAFDVNVHDYLVQSAGKCVMVGVASSRSVMNLCISPFFIAIPMKNTICGYFSLKTVYYSIVYCGKNLDIMQLVCHSLLTHLLSFFPSPMDFSPKALPFTYLYILWNKLHTIYTTLLPTPINV